MKKRTARPGLIERALIEREWHQKVIDAQIHALCGDNPQGLVDATGRVLFVILEAAAIDGYDFPQGEFQAINFAIVSMYDQVDNAQICLDHRARIICGLESAEKSMPLIRRNSIVQAACKLKEKLNRNHIHLTDFDEIIKRVKNTQSSKIDMGDPSVAA